MNEKLRIEERSGVLFYVADVSANHEEIAFRLASCELDTVTFENPEHDFPKRITYVRNGPDEFSAHITDFKEKGFDLVFTRVTDTP